MYTRMSFTVRGHVSLADLTQFLYDFYSAGHLQQIRQMTMKPVEHAGELDVNVTIEALSLPNADRKDQLSKEQGTRASAGQGRRLPRPDREAEPVRPLHAAAHPLRRVAKTTESPKAPVDTAQFTFVTGIYRG